MIEARAVEYIIWGFIDLFRVFNKVYVYTLAAAAARLIHTARWTTALYNVNLYIVSLLASRLALK